MATRVISSDILYAIGGILLGVNLLIYPVWVIIGPDAAVNLFLKRIFWFSGSIFSIPILVGLVLDPRVMLWVKFGLGFLLILCLPVVLVLFPFSVRTYTFDILTSFVSVLGLILFIGCLYLIVRRTIFIAG